MQIHQLKSKSKRKKSIKVGRGGKRGKTSGRGTKGQKARAGRKIRPEFRDVIKRIPKLRGHGKNRSNTVNSRVIKPKSINISALEQKYNENDTVNLKSLIESKLIKKNSNRKTVKILGEGDISKKLNIDGLLISKSAKLKIEKAGGSVINS